jgi:hypothetical protein
LKRPKKFELSVQISDLTEIKLYKAIAVI